MIHGTGGVDHNYLPHGMLKSHFGHPHRRKSTVRQVSLSFGKGPSDTERRENTDSYELELVHGESSPTIEPILSLWCGGQSSTER